MSQSDYILLGEISGVSGLKGWVKVFSHTDPRLHITDYDQWLLQKKGKSRSEGENWTPVKLLNGRVQGKNIIAQLDGVTTRDQAEAMIGMQIAIRSDQLKSLSANEYYWKDLIGLSVETTEGVNLGKIDWVFNSGSNDVLVIKDDSDDVEKNGTERMVPFLLNDTIISIDMDKSQMVVDWDPEF